MTSAIFSETAREMVAPQMDLSALVLRMPPSFLVESSRSRKVSESAAKEAVLPPVSREKTKMNRKEAIWNRERAIFDAERANWNRQLYFLNRERAVMNRSLLAMNRSRHILNRQLLANDS
jgi:hypothetical protein